MILLQNKKIKNQHSKIMFHLSLALKNILEGFSLNNSFIYLEQCLTM